MWYQGLRGRGFNPTMGISRPTKTLLLGATIWKQTSKKLFTPGDIWRYWLKTGVSGGVMLAAYALEGPTMALIDWIHMKSTYYHNELAVRKHWRVLRGNSPLLCDCRIVLCSFFELFLTACGTVICIKYLIKSFEHQQLAGVILMFWNFFPKCYFELEDKIDMNALAHHHTLAIPNARTTLLLDFHRTLVCRKILSAEGLILYVCKQCI